MFVTSVFNFLKILYHLRTHDTRSKTRIVKVDTSPNKHGKHAADRQQKLASASCVAAEETQDQRQDPVIRHRWAQYGFLRAWDHESDLCNDEGNRLNRSLLALEPYRTAKSSFGR